MKHKFIIELESNESVYSLYKYLKEAIETWRYSGDPDSDFFKEKLKLKIKKIKFRIPNKLTIKEAREQDFLIDFDTYTAYKGGFDKPKETRNVYTEFEEFLLRMLGEII